ncbi:hypothetical protein [Caballeronia concitans]|uniref:Fis family transcriptional regulator n=1 Tax=Caballeronia concitans TaxID=1777133 RepID=A0A658QUW2_9BURK|nr:hypothetical protein [Caballeronia concitans]KIG07625.1 hypothetical protein BurMR1_0455 [Burkholderia sp. MR1]SAL23646.1 Fis family transcriptional regulator [Caballeronia concitans]
MSNALPFARSPQATQKRLSKAQLLPIPRAVADNLALQAHLSLEALRAGSPDIGPAQHITEVMLLARFLAEAGHGCFPDEALRDADATMANTFARGDRSRVWTVDANDLEQLAAIVSLYDHQLRRASLAALTIASARLDQLKAGEPYRDLQKRRA